MENTRPMTRHSVLSVLMASCLVAPFTVQADELRGNFVFDEYGDAIASQGSVDFKLSGDGTIAAVVHGIAPGIVVFAYDATPSATYETGFSPNPVFTFNAAFKSYNPQGVYMGGWVDSLPAFSSETDTERWTIGIPGQYTSVWQTLGGGGANYDFFIYNEAFTYAGNALSYARAASVVPEPATRLLLIAALGLLGLWQRKTGSHRA